MKLLHVSIVLLTVAIAIALACDRESQIMTPTSTPLEFDTPVPTSIAVSHPTVTTQPLDYPAYPWSSPHPTPTPDIQELLFGGEPNKSSFGSMYFW